MDVADEFSPLIDRENPLQEEPRKDNSNQHFRTDSVCFRYIVLVIICLSAVGSFFCLDNPAALEEHMLNDMNISLSEYMLFYSSVQWLQLGSCLFGGYLIDRIFGIRWGVVLSSVFITLTQVTFAGGAVIDSYWTMVVGRMAYGIFDGTQWIAINSYICKWFKNKELNMVFGLKISIARAGTVANMNLMGPIYSGFSRYYKGHVCLGMTLFVGAGICLVSTICAGVLFILDKRRDSVISPSEKSKSSDGVKLSDIKHFPVTFWAIVMILTCYLQVILSFTGIGLIFFKSKYLLDSSVATNLNSLGYLIAAFAMPIFGIVIDRVGRNLYWMFLGLILQLICHLLLAFTFTNPYIPMSILGISFSVTSSTMWPMIPYVVEMKNNGTAFGMACTLLSIFQAGTFYLVGYLADNHGYLVVEMLLLTFTCVALVLGSLLYITDSAQGGTLNLTRKERDAYFAALIE